MPNEPKADWEKEALELHHRLHGFVTEDGHYRAQIRDLATALRSAHASGAREAGEKRSVELHDAYRAGWNDARSHPDLVVPNPEEGLSAVERELAEMTRTMLATTLERETLRRERDEWRRVAQGGGGK